MTVRLRGMSIPIFILDYKACLKIGTHLLSNRSLDRIRTLTVQPFSLPFSWIADAHATTSGSDAMLCRVRHSWCDYYIFAFIAFSFFWSSYFIRTKMYLGIWIFVIDSDVKKCILPGSPYTTCSQVWFWFITS